MAYDKPYAIWWCYTQLQSVKANIPQEKEREERKHNECSRKWGIECEQCTGCCKEEGWVQYVCADRVNVLVCTVCDNSRGALCLMKW